MLANGFIRSSRGGHWRHFLEKSRDQNWKIRALENAQPEPTPNYDGLGPIGVNQFIGAQTPDYFKEQLSIARWVDGWPCSNTLLTGDCYRLHQIMFAPAFYPAGQNRRVDAMFPELLRHTDASCIAG